MENVRLRQLTFNLNLTEQAIWPTDTQARGAYRCL